MPLPGQNLEFVFAFYKNAALFTPPAVTVTPYRPDNSPLSPGSATEITTGLLRYQIAGANVDVAGMWKAIAVSSDVTVDLPQVAAVVEVRTASDGGGGGGDPFEIATAVWERLVPAAFPAGSAGEAVGRLRAGGVALVHSHVAATSDVHLHVNKDNAATIGTSLTWTISNPPGWAASATWAFSCKSAGLLKSMVYNAGALTLELSAAETALFRPGLHRYEIISTHTGLRRRWFIGNVVASGEV